MCVGVSGADARVGVLGFDVCSRQAARRGHRRGLLPSSPDDVVIHQTHEAPAAVNRDRNKSGLERLSKVNQPVKG